MADLRVDERLRFELAPPIRVWGRLSVAAYLRGLLDDPEPRRWPLARKNALRLAAVTYQVAKCFTADLGAAPQPPTPRRWRPQLESGAQSVRAAALVWSGVEPWNVRPLPLTRAYLNLLPDDLVDRVLNWAPPVVVPFDRGSKYWVVACHVAALVARHRRPDADVSVRQLRGRVRRDRTLLDVCAGAVPALKPLFRRHRRFLARIAVDDAEARCLAGYSRAQYFRIKDGG